ncbi:stage II sporulation protein M [Paenibacillus sp. 481]|uniref:stage II sporulation protein M n=1 Tax=Paenibacillus sp. 481 TaxID=2835869 RepID=UPI001E5278F4|nr:stage II sporulation protein M [Paenibacillus sp. 481]UHA72904.1 stage II sporulation protein M [Paenibacillus sp. 481]
MKLLAQSFHNQVHLYVFVTVLFVVGVVFGALLVNALTFEQQQDIARHLGQFFVTVETEQRSADRSEQFWSSLLFYWKWIGVIALLGISIIGFPLILALDFIKGTLVGFTVGTLVSQYSWKGMLFAFVSVAPPNLIAIPLVLMCSVASLALAFHILKHRLLIPKMNASREPLKQYIVTHGGAAGGMIVVAALVTWISPPLMQWAASLFTQVG